MLAEMNTPRNSLCSCGSGKKFKRCCWNPVSLTPAMIPPKEIHRAEADTVVSPRFRRSPSLIMLVAATAAIGLRR